MSGEDEWEVWVELYRITERRDGCAYRTEFVRCDWVPMSAHGDGKDMIYVPTREWRPPRRRQTD